jgi:hypothetical protein
MLKLQACAVGASVLLKQHVLAHSTNERGFIVCEPDINIKNEPCSSIYYFGLFSSWFHCCPPIHIDLWYNIIGWF